MTLGGTTLTGVKSLRERVGPLLPGSPHIGQPGRAGDNATADQLEATILELGPENVAAFVGEPGRPIAADWPDAELIITPGLGHRRILRDDHVRGVVVAALTDDLARAVHAGASRNLGAHQPRADGGERGTEGERHGEPLAHQEPRRELSGAPRA